MHRRLRVRARRVVLPRVELKPVKPRWAVSRLLLAFVLALLIHGLFWLVAPKHRPAPTGSHGVIEVDTVRRGQPKKPDRAPVVSKAPQVNTPQVKPHRPEPKPAPQDTRADQKAYEPSPSDKAAPSAPVVSNPAPQQPATGGAPAPAPATRPDGSRIQLFDPSAMGHTVETWKESLPSDQEFLAPGSHGDGNSPAEEKARVSSRLAGQFAQSEAEGRVAGGLVSSCNDGYDQGQDGLMDCADQGCRMLPACQNTKEYKNYEAKQILDYDTRGTTSLVTVDDGDDEKIRSLSVQVNLVHSSPGDLEVELEHNGHKEVLRLADRSGHFFEKAFLAADFIGSDATGKWTLRIRDVIRGTAGTLRGWTLFVTR